MSKQITRFLRTSLLALLTFCMGFAAFACNKPVEPAPETKLVTGITVTGTGVTGAGTVANPYIFELEKGGEKTFNYAVTPTDASDKSLAASYSTAADFTNPATTSTVIEVVPTVSDMKVKIKALDAAGHDTNYYFILTATDGGAKVYGKVHTAPANPAVLVDEIIIEEATQGAITGGNGTITTPYAITVPLTQSVNLIYDIDPTDADERIEFVYCTDETFAAVESAPVFTAASPLAYQIRVTSLAGGTLGTYYFYVVSKDGNAKSYCSVTITEFTPVAEINLSTSNSLQTAAEEAAWDYEFTTMAGTQLNIGRGENTTAKTNWSNHNNKIPNIIDNTRYYYDLYKFNFTAAADEGFPSNSMLRVAYYSDAALTQAITEGNTPVLLTPSQPGGENNNVTTFTYEVRRGGETVYVKIYSSTNTDVIKIIKITTVESAYAGISKADADAFEAVTVTKDTWDLDSSDRAANIARLDTLRFSVLNSNDSANNKIFHMGNDAASAYGFAFENYSDANSSLNDVAEIVWTKVNMPAAATFFRINVGTNDRKALQTRISLVDPTGALAPAVLLDWEQLTQGGKIYGATDADRMNIPEDYKGKVALLIVEARYTEKTNTELQVKGMWIDQYSAVTGVTFAEKTQTAGQGGSLTIAPSVAPSGATNTRVTYSIAPTGKGVTINSATGKVDIAADADTTVTYTITATSEDKPAISDTYTLTVTVYVPVTAIDINKESFEATFAEPVKMPNGDAYVNHTDSPVTLVATLSTAGGTASVNTVTWEIIEGDDVIGLSANGLNAIVSFKKAGTAKVKVSSDDKPAMFKICTITVTEAEVSGFISDKAVVAGVSVNASDAENKAVSGATSWSNKNEYSEWAQKIVGGNHGANKIISDDNWIRAEAHTSGNDAANISGNNWKLPTVVVWNKIAISATHNSFSLEVAAHNDGNQYFRFNYRVRAIVLNDDGTLPETPAVITLQDWVSVSKAYASNQQVAYLIAADVSAYQGKTLLVLIEGAAAWKDNTRPGNGNGNGWMWVKNIKLQDAAATDIRSGYDFDLITSSFTGTADSDYVAGARTNNNKIVTGKVTIEGVAGATSILPALTFDNYRLIGIFPALMTNGTDNVNPTLDVTALNAAIVTFDSTTRTFTLVSSGTTSINVVYKNLVTGASQMFTLTIDATVLTADNPVTEVNLNKDSLNATFGKEKVNDIDVVYTDPAFQLTATVNDDASVKTITWTVEDGDSVTVTNGGLVTFVKAGVATVRATAVGGVYAECVITVTARDTAITSIDADVLINKTEAERKALSEASTWNDKAGRDEWSWRITGGHSNNKQEYSDNGDIAFVAHSSGNENNNNKTTPNVIMWNKVTVPAGAETFSITVAPHGDANAYFRFNYRIRLVTITGEDAYGSVVDLTGWNSVSKTKAAGGLIWHTIAADVTAYQGQTVIIIIEGVGAWRDSAKPVGTVDGNGWMHVKNIEFSDEAKVSSVYGWDLPAITDAKYEDGMLTIEEGKTITLPAEKFDNYRLTGIFNALKTNGTGNIDPTLDGSEIDELVATFDSGNLELTAVAAGETSIKVIYKNIETGADEVFLLTIKVVAAA